MHSALRTDARGSHSSDSPPVMNLHLSISHVYPTCRHSIHVPQQTWEQWREALVRSAGPDGGGGGGGGGGSCGSDNGDADSDSESDDAGAADGDNNGTDGNDAGDDGKGSVATANPAVDGAAVGVDVDQAVVPKKRTNSNPTFKPKGKQVILFLRWCMENNPSHSDCAFLSGKAWGRWIHSLL